MFINFKMDLLFYASIFFNLNSCCSCIHLIFEFIFYLHFTLIIITFYFKYYKTNNILTKQYIIIWGWGWAQPQTQTPPPPP